MTTSRRNPEDLAKPQLLASEVLDKAADLLTPEGAWTQYAFARDILGRGIPWAKYYDRRDEAVCLCASGAIYEAAYSLGATPADFNAKTEFSFVQTATDNDAGWVPGWNDAEDRTKSEVVDGLRKAADLAREAGQ